MKWLGREGIKGGRRQLRAFSLRILRFLETGSPIRSEELEDGGTNDPLLCFSDLSTFTSMSDSAFVLLKPIRIRSAAHQL